MNILDKTEIRNKEEDDDMRKIHSLPHLSSSPRYYDAAFWSYHRWKYWNTDEYKDDRESLRKEQEEEVLGELEWDLRELFENNDITEKEFNEGIAEINGELPEGTTGLIEEIEIEIEEDIYSLVSEQAYERGGHITEDDWSVEEAAIYDKTDECYCGCNENKYICLYTPCCDKKMHLICLYAAMCKKDDDRGYGGRSLEINAQHCPYCRACWDDYHNTLFPAQ